MLMIPKADIFYFQPSGEYKSGTRNILKPFQILAGPINQEKINFKLHWKINSYFIMVDPFFLLRRWKNVNYHRET